MNSNISTSLMTTLSWCFQLSSIRSRAWRGISQFVNWAQDQELFQLI